MKAAGNVIAAREALDKIEQYVGIGSEEGNGFAQLMQQLPQERLILAVGAVAAMESALEVTIDYAKERKAFGKPKT